MSEKSRVLDRQAYHEYCVRFFRSKLSEATDARVKCNLTGELWMHCVHLKQYDEALTLMQKMLTDTTITQDNRDMAAELLLNTYFRKSREAKTEEAFLQLHTVAGKKADELIEQCEREGRNADRLLKQKRLLSMEYLETILFDVDGKFIPYEERISKRPLNSATSGTSSTPPSAGGTSVGQIVVTPDKTSSSTIAGQWPIEHSEKVRGLAKRFNLDLEKIDSDIQNEPNLISTHRAYFRLHRLCREAKEEGNRKLVARKYLDSLNRYIEENADNEDWVCKARGWSLEALLWLGDHKSYVARIGEWGLRDFETYRKYSIITRPHNAYPLYIEMLHTLPAYAGGDENLTSETTEQILDETRNWETKYEWAKNVPKDKLEDLRFRMGLREYRAYSSLGWWHSRQQNYARSLELYQKALEAIPEIPASLNWKPEVRAGFVKEIEQAMDKVRAKMK